MDLQNVVHIGMKEHACHRFSHTLGLYKSKILILLIDEEK